MVAPTIYVVSQKVVHFNNRRTAMRKAICFTIVAVLLLCSSCSRRVVDFTIISTKNIDLSRADMFERATYRARGEDKVHWIIIIPTGVPNMKEALDRAIESVPGSVALVDGVITTKFWYIPYVYGEQWFVAEGTPLIDPQLASATFDAGYIVTRLDQEGEVLETRAISEGEYESLKPRKRIDS